MCGGGKGLCTYSVLRAQVGKLTLLQDHHVFPDGVQVSHDLLQRNLLNKIHRRESERRGARRLPTEPTYKGVVERGGNVGVKVQSIAIPWV